MIFEDPTQHNQMLTKIPTTYQMYIYKRDSQIPSPPFQTAILAYIGAKRRLLSTFAVSTPRFARRSLSSARLPSPSPFCQSTATLSLALLILLPSLYSSLSPRIFGLLYHGLVGSEGGSPCLSSCYDCFRCLGGFFSLRNVIVKFQSTRILS
ncbi:hypothetical protein Nepgr_011167 [Nepenthes gracilis]|uniref:Uncharacterized protein n=1 Tax=Nepenthes gracilis TaxID=150966 RepID=A0AAD3SEP0_NEPGR|nr:hypothetical protein Nepgr_011167 [Nepenthes gracilis]